MTVEKKINLALSIVATVLSLVAPVCAADPGVPLPANSELNDQKVGSVLFFNFFSSKAANLNVENTRINITNTNSSSNAAILLLFVNGAGGSPAVTSYIYFLTRNQTSSFLISDFDPGVRGYLIVVAVDSMTGCPTGFNYLSGDEYIKIEGGHSANLAAEAFSALFSGILTGCDGGSISATLNFDGISYNRLPQTLALDKVRSLDDGNSMLLILNRIGGSLAAGGGGPAVIGSITGELIDDLANSYAFNFTSNTTQLAQTLSSSFPKNTPPLFNTIVPAGRTGWMTLAGLNNTGLLGSAINFNPNVATNASAFRGGRNLRKLTLSTANSITIPIIAPR